MAPSTALPTTPVCRLLTLAWLALSVQIAPAASCKQPCAPGFATLPVEDHVELVQTSVDTQEAVAKAVPPQHSAEQVSRVAPPSELVVSREHASQGAAPAALFQETEPRRQAARHVQSEQTNKESVPEELVGGLSTDASSREESKDGGVESSNKQVPILYHQTQADVILTTVLLGLLGLVIVSSIKDFHECSTLLFGSGCKKDVEQQAAVCWKTSEEDGASAVEPAKPPARSLLTILGLTVWRFYTGFLSATWLPYLLAMEGAELWIDNQALFMGIAKLIYGMSILLTPLFGLLGDRLAIRSHALGRRLFVRAGIIVAAVGIFMCHWASARGHFWFFGIGVLVWRLGEGLNDVTTEAICPEMLPPEQFAISSAIRASMFLVGGLMGYVLVAAFAHLHYSWLYHGYLIMMYICGIPSLLLINESEVVKRSRVSVTPQRPFFVSCVQAYIQPSQYPGGFPLACLCIFIFSCGSAPMYFMLLMLRDLVGIEDHVLLQTHFSFISITFFLSAAVAAALNALMAPKRPKLPAHETAIRISSFRVTAASVALFGIFCIIMPCVRFFPTRDARAKAFYILAGLMGGAFGSVYARFQDCTWQLLPANIDTANAMGFSTMWKLLGAGLGNFVAGLVLDLFQRPNQHAVHAMIAYDPSGYIVMCTGSAFLAFLTGVLVLWIPSRAGKGSAAKAKEAMLDAPPVIPQKLPLDPKKEEPEMPLPVPAAVTTAHVD